MKKRLQTNFLWLTLLTIPLASCHSIAQEIPNSGDTKTALVLKVRPGKKAYFLFTPEGGSEERLVTSNYSVEDRHYILNAPSGTYVFVGTSASILLVKESNILNEASARKLTFTVQTGKVTYAGIVFFSGLDQPDEWAKTMLKQIAPGSFFSQVGFHRAAAKMGTLYNTKENIEELKGFVAADLGNTPWNDITCTVASCKSEGRYLGVEQKAPPESIVTVVSRGYAIGWLRNTNSRGNQITFSFDTYQNGTFYTAPGRLKVEGIGQSGYGRTDSYTVELGERQSGETVVICTRSRKQGHNRYELETSVQDSELKCDQWKDGGD